MRRLFACSLTAAAIAIAAPAAADTIVTGGTVINQTWTAAGSPYIVQGDITVPTGAFLTLEAGVVVQASASDSQGSGHPRVEVIVRGTLTANGTVASPVTFTGVSPSAGTWYGIVVDATAAQVSMTHTSIAYAIRGLSTAAPAGIVTASNLTVQNASEYGLYASAGSLSIDGFTAIANGTAGAYVGLAASATFTNCVARSNSSYGFYFAPTSGGRTLAINGCTIYGNGSFGVYSNGSIAGTATVTGSIITHQSFGMHRADSSSITATYSNVWNNSSGNFSGGASSSTGVISTNPLYVSAPNNLRLTSNSPSRFGAMGGGDMGALPYINDPTPGLYGTLWNNTTLTAAGSPYTVQGDLTVPAGVTLTIEPGATLSFSASDIMVASHPRAELQIAGRLLADGTPANRINLTGASPSPGTWFGVDLMPGSTGSVLDNVTISYPIRGVSVRTTGAGTYAALVLQNTSEYGFYAIDGTPTVDQLQAIANGTAGVYVGSAASATFTNCVARSNSSYGFYFAPTSGGRTLTINGCTIYGNGSFGVYSNGSIAGTATVTGSIITHQSFGVHRADSSSITATYSNVWNNSSGNFSGGASSSTGVISTNPLYVSAPNNLRLTSNSPSRFGAMGGGDMGALPYINDPTPGLYGTLWNNTTLTAAGSPYTVQGDLTVPAGVTLTIEPGATLSFSASDIMVASHPRAELQIAGRLLADGTPANRINLTGASPSPGTWYGVDLMPGSAGTVLNNATISYPIRGVSVRTTGAGTYAALVLQNTSEYGFYAIDGTATVDQLQAIANGTAGVYVGSAASATFTNCVARSNSSYGFYFAPTSGGRTLTINGCTIYGNGSFGVYSNGSIAGTAIITNAIVTHQSFGVHRADSSSVTATYSDVWNNSSGNFSGGATSGTGVISQNPNYVSAPTNLHLQGTSVCIDAGTTGPTTDADGVTRPLDGNGLAGAQWDMGAYEFVLVPTCGNGAVEPGETCDSGASNGMYGACNANCTALGPRCGDNVPNGPEQCDDANPSNTDACLTTCRNAACGDGFVRAGTEACDDGNLINTDGCVGACALATCGDGYVRGGVEACDDGNMIDTDACRNTCEASACGDGVVQAGEECDDHNGVDTDACRNSCMNARCGDGVTRSGVEECDDGNMVNTDACTASCQTAECGDGITRIGTEECDDANMVNTDACVGVCVSARCGDGYTRTGIEGCDDGNTNNSDACTNACVSSTCGDGVVQAGVETCDDANLVDTDACRNNCAQASCGDGVIHVGVEACDDGNMAAGDGCGATCQVEAGPDGGGGGGPDAGGGGGEMSDGDGCCSSGGVARDTSLLGALAVLLTLRRRRRARA